MRFCACIFGYFLLMMPFIINTSFASEAAENKCLSAAGEQVKWVDIDVDSALQACQTALNDDPNNISVWTYFGRVLHKNEQYKEALKWYRKAADKHHPRAQLNIAIMYRIGEGVKQDYAEALNWYRLATDQGFANAQENTGYMYREGLGVPQDYAEALKWYRLAADQGLAAAQSNLGRFYLDGNGVKQDYAEAQKWYRLAADQGYATAQENLGYMYREGIGVPQDYAEALKWYRLAADQGLAAAQYNIGYMYDHGNGVRRNILEAAKWYQEAADKGFSRAQVRLGWFYERGVAFEQSKITAISWYKKAANQGNEMGRQALNRLDADVVLQALNYLETDVGNKEKYEQQITQAEQASTDIYSGMILGTDVILRLISQGHFKAAKLERNRAYARLTQVASPMLRAFGALVPAVNDVLDQEQESGDLTGLFSQYIMVKSALVGVCDEQPYPFVVTSQVVTKFFDQFGNHTNTSRSAVTERTFTVPSKFASIVSAANLTEANWLLVRGLKRMVQKAGGCESPELKQLEKNMRIYYSAYHSL